MRNKILNNSKGFSLVELLVALIITGILTISALSFYTSINQQVISQQEITDMQQLNRVCLEEISTVLKFAGYGLPDTHPAYESFTDSLSVYYNDSGSIDTTIYYLEEFTVAEYAANVTGPITNITLYKLMKKVDSEQPVIFAEFLTDLRFTLINAKLMAITVETQTAVSDETYNVNDGYRKFINTERVVIRNI